MAKGRLIGKEATNKEPTVWSKEWIEQNKEKLISSMSEIDGFKLVEPDEFDRKVKEKVDEKTGNAEVRKALEMLGINPENLNKSVNFRIVDQTKIVDDIASYIDLLYGTTAWRSQMTPEQKAGLHAIRVFIRQLRNEQAPPGQAATIADLMAGVKIPEGPLNARGEANKPIRVTQKLLSDLGIGV